MTEPNNHFILVHRINDNEPIHIHVQYIIAITRQLEARTALAMHTVTIIDVGAGDPKHAYHVTESVEQILKLIKGE